jgi:hypothetical protein
MCNIMDTWMIKALIREYDEVMMWKERIIICCDTHSRTDTLL